MPNFFISYRREDSAGYAGRLYDRLSKHFGEESVFMDIDTMEPGIDFFEVIEDAINRCDILVVVIGKRWLSIMDATEQRRLDNPDDFVRVEVQTALEREIRVIPVLVGGAAMPSSRDLPDVITKLARRNALELSDTRWHADVGKLIETAERISAAAQRHAEEERQRREKAEAAQRRAEEERRQKEEAAAAQRHAEEEQQRREQAAAAQRRTEAAQRRAEEERLQQQEFQAQSVRLQAQRDHEAKLEQYMQTFRQFLTQYPFSEENKRALQLHQRELGLTSEEVRCIVQPLLEEAEAACLREQEAKVARLREQTKFNRRQVEQAVAKRRLREQEAEAACLREQKAEAARLREQTKFNRRPVKHKLLYLLVLALIGFTILVFVTAR